LILGAILKAATILTGIMFAVGNPEAAQTISDLIWNGFDSILGVFN